MLPHLNGNSKLGPSEVEMPMQRPRLVWRRQPHRPTHKASTTPQEPARSSTGSLLQGERELFREMIARLEKEAAERKAELKEAKDEVKEERKIRKDAEETIIQKQQEIDC